MSTIKHEDFVQSVADALQYISYYHPPDFVAAMAQAHAREQSPAAKDAIADHPATWEAALARSPKRPRA